MMSLKYKFFEWAYKKEIKEKVDEINKAWEILKDAYIPYQKELEKQIEKEGIRVYDKYYYLPSTDKVYLKDNYIQDTFMIKGFGLSQVYTIVSSPPSAVYKKIIELVKCK